VKYVKNIFGKNVFRHAIDMGFNILLVVHASN